MAPSPSACGPAARPRCAPAPSPRPPCTGSGTPTAAGSCIATSSRRTCCSATASVLKVADFGIAKVVGAQGARLTATAALLGTPAYMAPRAGQLVRRSPVGGHRRLGDRCRALRAARRRAAVPAARRDQRDPPPADPGRSGAAGNPGARRSAAAVHRRDARSRARPARPLPDRGGVRRRARGRRRPARAGDGGRPDPPDRAAARPPEASATATEAVRARGPRAGRPPTPGGAGTRAAPVPLSPPSSRRSRRPAPQSPSRSCSPTANAAVDRLRAHRAAAPRRRARVPAPGCRHRPAVGRGRWRSATAIRCGDRPARPSASAGAA